MQFKQESNELFWKYFERFKDLLVQCPHHEIEKWRQSKILYDGLDHSTKTLFETMRQGDSCKRMKNKGRDLYENLA